MKTKWFLRMFAVAAGVSLASCTDPDEGSGIVFPDETSVTLSAGETKTLTFEAKAAWTLDVGTAWCYFVDGEDDVKQLSDNKAGTVTVTIKATDAGLAFDEDDVATVTLAMVGASEPRTIYTVTRPGRAREVKVYHKDGNNYTEMENGVVMAFKENRTAIQQICFTTNFEWKVLSKSDEITLSGLDDLNGTANQTPSEAVVTYIQLATSVLHAPYTGEIVISDPTGEKKVSVPVTYPGMGDEDLFFSELYLRAGNEASVNFSNKGYLMGRGSGAGPTEDKSFPFTAISKDLKSKGYVVTLDTNNVPSIATDSWLVLEDDQEGNYTVSIAGNGVNLGEARTLHVFVLPESLATATPDFAQWFTDGVSKGIYTFSVSQAAAPSEASLFLAWQGGEKPVAENRIVTWTDYADAQGWVDERNPGDRGGPTGLAGEDAIVYQFIGTDIDGDFLIAVMGMDVKSHDTWAPGIPVCGPKLWTAGTYKDLYSVSTSGIEDFTDGVTYRQTWVHFTKQGSYMPNFGVLLRQKKTVVE